MAAAIPEVGGGDALSAGHSPVDERPEPPIVVVDTDVVSFLFKRDSRAALYQPHLEGRRPVLSAQALAELCAWPIARHWGQRRRQELDEFLGRYPVIYPDAEICRMWGEITARAALAGKPLPATDAWHAATAIYLGVPLASHNRSNYLGVPELSLVTPGEGT
jgi:tRNA(fMet)-specific endonuclease VapC